MNTVLRAAGAMLFAAAGSIAGLVVPAAPSSAASPTLAFATRAGLTRHAVAASPFNPTSVTFVSLSTGWALGNAPCGSAGRCLALRRTTTSGRTWSAEALPPALVSAAGRASGAPGTPGMLEVRFADARDGWIFGPVAGGQGQVPVLWSTHDGGATWSDVAVRAGLGPRSSIFDLEAANGTAWLLAQRSEALTPFVTLEATSYATDGWHRVPAPQLGLPAGGSQAGGAIVLQGSRGWVVEGNDRGISGSARLASDGRWTAWAPPCASVGDSYTVPAAATASVLYAVCVMGGFAYPMPKHAPPGATLGSTWLYRSTDGGKTFQWAAPLPLKAYVYYWGPLASPKPGTVFAERSSQSRQQLVASFDGGHHWENVYAGNFSYLGFTSPSQGAGIVQVSATTSAMVMSFDGGHTWRPVHF